MDEEILNAFYSAKQERLMGKLLYHDLDGNPINITEIRRESVSNWEDAVFVGKTSISRYVKRLTSPSVHW